MLMSSPKTLGHAASDFEEFSGEELEGTNLARGQKGFGVPALYKQAHSYQDGLRPGDIILSLDDRSFGSTEDLNNYIRAKPELDIAIEFLRDGTIYNMKTKLQAEQDLQKECRTIEELREIADFGDPYTLLRARSSLGKTHWDFLGIDMLPDAQKMAQGHQRPLLVSLFGSSVCCVHLAPWTPPYKEFITHPSVQKVVRDDYVSLLVVKPEAYRLYRQYRIDSRFPALLRITGQAGLEPRFSIRPDGKVGDILSFLQKTAGEPEQPLITMEEPPSLP
jgi:hypothetical protein